jgi:hypothetical protein
MGMPRPVFLAAAGLFVLSIAGTVVALGIFFWHAVDFWYHFEVGGVFKMATVLSTGLAISSGLLFFHCGRQESYMTFEAIFFLVCFGISLCDLLWLLPGVIFG